MIENIYQDDLLLAIVVRSNFKKDGIEFFTDNNSSQQLGYMNRQAGYYIAPHRHNLVTREVKLTQEVLVIKSGKVRVDFFDNAQNYLQSSILNSGDVILLSDGGHGFKMLEDSEIFEVKQGPYCGEEDKVRFEAVSEEKIIIK
ncbi:MAG: hypothetical protein WC622_09550 [Pedobacter sp.]|uniref:hypothetical protein n=1 Tax=Pedobacter sp. TaxID=1411316 RepID=UPI003567C57C